MGFLKMGKDLGIFAGDAILSDMTLLRCWWWCNPGGKTTLGGIGTGYLYPAWKGQIAYTTPNMNGFKQLLLLLTQTKVIQVQLLRCSSTDAKQTLKTVSVLKVK